MPNALRDRPAAGDSFATIAAVALIAYVAADLAHHGLGHAGACLALGGEVRSLSSVFVDCSLRGSAIDLAGPLANLVVGFAALAAARFAAETGQHPALLPGQGRTVRGDEAPTEAADDVGRTPST